MPPCMVPPISFPPAWSKQTPSRPENRPSREVSGDVHGPYVAARKMTLLSVPPPPCTEPPTTPASEALDFPVSTLPVPIRLPRMVTGRAPRRFSAGFVAAPCTVPPTLTPASLGAGRHSPEWMPSRRPDSRRWSRTAPLEDICPLNRHCCRATAPPIFTPAACRRNHDAGGLYRSPSGSRRCTNPMSPVEIIWHYWPDLPCTLPMVTRPACQPNSRA